MLFKQLQALPAISSLPRPSALPMPPSPKELVKKIPMALARKAAIVPFSLQKRLLSKVMGQAFQEPLEDGDFEFLKNKWMKIEISDIGLCWFFSYSEEGHLIVSDYEIENASIRGNLKEFIQLASRAEDPDTLFFQRKLMIEGDTEIGLEVKNLMDAVDHDSLPPLLKLILTKGAGLANKLF
ncbi:MAG: SCP2 sterol-binding domain-containing protein [Motiliproteus sp.]